jgi:hypothetical protein
MEATRLSPQDVTPVAEAPCLKKLWAAPMSARVLNRIAEAAPHLLVSNGDVTMHRGRVVPASVYHEA